ncbi:sensor histidine kinase [Neobacillus dielmonensis]|uniref:sensor histidine kinase n=1 Tax=Neobacillus dielmonensis TaxID=1347369 RepID=UPI0005A893B0|nr:ATP-binding protein [Neobacillus dielmonensis]
MKDKKAVTVYGRFLLIWLYCLLGGAISSFLFGYAAKFIYQNIPLPSAINYFFVDTYRTYGLWKLFFLATTILTLLYYFLWMYKKLAYFTLILNSSQKLSQGQFELDLPVRNAKGSLGSMANHLNEVKGQLEQLIEEEKRVIRSKNELVTNVSHDLRTPLTSIMGYLRLIEEDKYRDEVELRCFVNIAYEKANRLNRMVNDLFEFTKINNREIALKPVRFNVSELLRQLAEQFTPELQEANMHLGIHIPDKAISLEADPDKLMRVFENLFSNAIKYGKDGKKIDLYLEDRTSYVVVKLVNYGQPIPAKAIPLIFERMYRIDQSRTAETGGTGLGLAIAKGIVDMHHGEISVSSNERETIFQVQLPIRIAGDGQL